MDARPRGLLVALLLGLVSLICVVCGNNFQPNRINPVRLAGNASEGESNLDLNSSIAGGGTSSRAKAKASNSRGGFAKSG